MKRLVLALLTIAWIAWASSARAELVVVVNQDNPVSDLSSRQVIDLYMGRFNAYPDGSSVLTTDLPSDSPVREAFYRQLVGKSVAQINAYWARLLFTGKSEPPQTIPSINDVVDYVKNNKNAIAYIHEAELTQGLKVVYRFEDPQ
ncbi:type 2 periplasmic-binding domain-containing protein [Enterovibrio calviensis]|uniref:hypothetical protein n=1 Tax=Enterovibrio calviensis TaxID=91359 RepID=UPI0004842606|nr:hypothetical protein [Enterovibrio calviensis]